MVKKLGFYRPWKEKRFKGQEGTDFDICFSVLWLVFLDQLRVFSWSITW